MNATRLEKQVKALILFFIVALLVSGITAFPIRWEIDILVKLVGPGTWMEALWPAMTEWLAFVHKGVADTYQAYPFLAYGTDWLAFAHIVIAIAFIGPLRDPVKNVWVIEFGLIACVLVLPLALICGPIRGIPFFWRLIDCSFGVIGFITLWATRNMIQGLEETAS